MQQSARPPRYAVERQVCYCPRPGGEDLALRAAVVYRIWDRAFAVFLPGGFATPADATAHIPSPADDTRTRGVSSRPTNGRARGPRRRVLAPVYGQ